MGSAVYEGSETDEGIQRGENRDIKHHDLFLKRLMARLLLRGKSARYSLRCRHVAIYAFDAWRRILEGRRSPRQLDAAGSHGAYASESTIT
jgi:hypothetical protein